MHFCRLIIQDSLERREERESEKLKKISRSCFPSKFFFYGTKRCVNFQRFMVVIKISRSLVKYGERGVKPVISGQLHYP